MIEKVRSSVRPPEIEFLPNAVLINTNIQEYSEEVDGHILSGFEYDCAKYSKDEYLLQQTNQIKSLQEELAAAKILLGVE